MKIAIYSHDAMGLGHMRRNLLISEALGHGPSPAHVLLIAGAPELGAFQLPPHVDAVMLPPFVKTTHSGYVPRSPFDSAERLAAMRARIIQAALSSFVPDVFISDKHPRGLMRELDYALGDLRALGHTRFVLGLRDILDHPFAVRRDWLQDGNVVSIRETYDMIWVYGDAGVYDPRSEYGFSTEISRKLRFTGYLDPSSRLLPSDPDGIDASGVPERFALCLVGGGQDGGDLARSFAEAVLSRRTLQGCLVTGPFMPRETKSELLALAGTDARLRVLDFVRNPGLLLRRANRVVTMCGYNALTEAITLRVPVLGIPRVRPRVEQLIRARAFEERGLIDVLYPDDATPEAIASWLETDLPAPPPAHERIDFKGLERLPMFLEDIVPARPVSSRQNGVRRS